MVAFAVMDADRIATFRTNPAGVFNFHEFLDADCLNLQQVFDHAHAVFGTVTRIELS